jgi:AraC-like DNA-binding protein
MKSVFLHSEMLLRNTGQPVGDIAFSSGFNSIEHFSAAFKQKYKCAPVTFRQVGTACFLYHPNITN